MPDELNRRLPPVGRLCVMLGASPATADRPVSPESRLRLTPLAAGLVLALGLVQSPVRAQDASLPDIG